MTAAMVESGRVPDLDPHRAFTVPEQVERVLPNGLTVLAIARRTVPLVELRLRVPFADVDRASGAVLAQTLFRGTKSRSNREFAATLQAVGGAIGAGVDPDRLQISGNALSTGLDTLLELLAEAINEAAYAGQEVMTERARLANRIKVALSQPSHLVRSALLERVYGSHPYAVQTPSGDDVEAVEPEHLRELHARRLHPGGATLVLVGDFDPDTVLDQVAEHFAGWRGAGPATELLPPPPLEPGPLLIVNRPGAVQSSLRLALPAVARSHPDNAPLQLANLIFGGYFSSRWVENIREDKGYTYGPHSMIDHSVAGSKLMLSADVATDVTAPALMETFYELGRIATLAPDPAEIDQARQFALGTLVLGMSTQSGLAGLASGLAGAGLRMNYLVEHAGRLSAATVDEVHRAAQQYLAPAGAVGVVLGDAERIERHVAAISAIKVRP
ncbi:M16 family metallopeptidase [Sphaerisporangium perillae]|uniref:M16 family metallopeptidase n=1 Tax=Sphaerisporangium perillae TaxID=2935860 RepID=UPI00200F95D0|nr:pitrilysin family protein [Sphaerisporangium perillae]